MDNRDILAIGASAGGLDALRFLVSRFAGDLAASVVVTLHLPAEFPSQLDRILTSAGPLRATFAADDERLLRGRIYLAPPARHLLVAGDRLQLGSGPRENHARPAIDPMLRSVAVCCGARAIGVVLTGTMSDGAAGLCALKECGGLTVIQDPADAAYAGMPQAALRRSRPDRIAPLSELPKLLQDLVQQIRGEQRPAPAQMRVEVAIARGEQIGIQDMDSLGSRSTFTCPDCGGVLWEIEKGGLLRYRCHLGHAYTAELVGSAQEDGSRDALSKTLRALRERLLLARRLEGEAVDKGWEDEARYWRQKLEQGEEQFAIVADALQKMHETSARTAED